jgi:hypothetical protein
MSELSGRSEDILRQICYPDADLILAEFMLHLPLSIRASVRRLLPIVIVQQARTRLSAQIGQQTFQAVGSNLDAGAVRFQEDGFTDEHGPPPDPGVALEDKDPGLVLCMELPASSRLKSAKTSAMSVASLGSSAAGVCANRISR